MTIFGIQCLRFKVQGLKVVVLRSLFSVYSLHCTAIQNSAFEIQNFNPESWFLRLASFGLFSLF